MAIENRQLKIFSLFSNDQRPPPPSKEIEITSDEDSGLPIGQQHHEAWRKFLRDQRNKEYNQLVEKVQHATVG